MPDKRSSHRDYYEDGIRREGAHAQPRRSSRPPQGRQPAPRRKKRTSPRLFLFAAVLLAIVVLAVVLLTGGRGDESPQPSATPTPAPQTGALTNATLATATPDNTQMETAQATDTSSTGDQTSALAQQLGDESAVLEPLPEEQRVKVDDLSINADLPGEWLNILLLGSDERSLNESARTDTMIICSINQSTREVKLTSIMRDVAVKYDDLGEHNGTYRINAANYFGGPEFAMKTVNECFGMNIQYYAMVNFFGFQKIAEALGGIDVDISEAEMNEINNKLYEQYKIGKKIGAAIPTVENDLMTSFGPNTHLNGHQTLAYARVRAIDSDFSRAERQRKVLTQLAQKLKQKSVPELMALGLSMLSEVNTNLDADTIMSIAVKVLEGGLESIETFRLPVNNSYTQDVRNEEAMFYDVDWTTNQRELYTFIYS